MKAIYVSSGNVGALKKHLSDFEKNNHVKSALFLMAYENHYSGEELLPLLKKVSKPVIGGVFPEIIYEGARKDEGVLLILLSTELRTQRFDLTETSEKYFSQLESLLDDPFVPKSGLLVFIDALSSGKQYFIESLFDFFGIFPTYMGGGAGSLRL
ncbi:MAG: FIST N-terminal domain-containing protein [Bacteroidales bacterium]